MPKITAPTVPEHRAHQRAALVHEAERILLADGAGAVTPAAVGRAVGLARSSVYEYFPSAGDLLAEVAHRSIQEWSAELDAAISPAGPGWPRLDAYIRASLRMVQEGKHDIADRLEGVDFAEAQVRRFMDTHDQLASPLPGIMGDIGIGDTALAGALVQGLVDAAARQVRGEVAADDACEIVMGLLRSGLVAGR